MHFVKKIQFNGNIFLLDHFSRHSAGTSATVKTQTESQLP